MYGITAIRVDEDKKRITHVRWCRIDPANNFLVRNPAEVPVHVAVSALRRGDAVVTLHSDGRENIFGAKARYAQLEPGFEGIETVDPERFPGRTLHDLPRF